ncbi:acetyltransferase domain-containing protein [Xylariaceae sp. FL1019]|nr:acetyltransferase domain-containing protein [Xylariaceae sp. FL1019]
MLFNKLTAVQTPNILLVPYDFHHVERYHEWMQDADLREATGSDLLSPEEEVENQQSWQNAHDKLTFIICTANAPSDGPAVVRAGTTDSRDTMIGDVNLFLAVDDEDGDHASKEGDHIRCKGELSIMLAEKRNRKQGYGSFALDSFLRYLGRNLDCILNEYFDSLRPANPRATEARLGYLFVKMHTGNKGSIALFEQAGFVHQGGVDYFGEVTMVHRQFSGEDNDTQRVEGYRELLYDRSGLTHLDQRT